MNGIVSKKTVLAAPPFIPPSVQVSTPLPFCVVNVQNSNLSHFCWSFSNLLAIRMRSTS